MLDHLDPDFKTSLIGFVSGLLGALVIFIKKILDKIADRLFEKKDQVVETLNVGKLVKDSLESLREEWHADRALIIQFHNGAHFFTGGSMQKFSVTYEEITPGTAPLYKVLQNIPLTNAMWLNDMITGNAIPNVEKMTDVLSRTFFEEFGVKCVIGAPLKNADKVIGVVMLQFTEKPCKFDEGVSQKLADQCKNIPPLLIKN